MSDDVQAAQEKSQQPEASGYSFGTKVLVLFGSLGLVTAGAVGALPALAVVGTGAVVYAVETWRREQAELAKMAKDLEFTLKALADPPGANKTELASLALLRGGVQDAIAGSPLSRASIDAAFLTVDDLDHQIGEIKKAAIRRATGQDPAQKEADARQDKLLGLINKFRTEARDAAAQTTARARDGLAAWEKLLKIDDEELDPDIAQAVTEARDEVLAEFTKWQTVLSGLWDQAFDEPDDISEGDIYEAAKAAHANVPKKDDILTERLKDVAQRASILDAEQKARLSSTDELRLTNQFSRAKKTPSRKEVTQFLTEGGTRKLPDAMIDNAMSYVAGLGSGASEVQKAAVSKQKPYAVIKNYLTATDNTLLPIFESALSLTSNDLLAKGLPNVAALAREIVRIGSADRDTNRWLVRLYLQGTKIAGLQRFYDNRNLLQGLPISGDYMAKLNQKMADPGFDAAIFGRLKARHGARPAWLFPTGIKAYLGTDDEDLGGKVAEDDYGLYGNNKPGNAQEIKIAKGLDDGVISMNQRATTKSAIHGPGYAFLFSYGDGQAAMYELHVHVKPGTNWHPAWKRCSAPREEVQGRAQYVIAPALKGKMG